MLLKTNGQNLGHGAVGGMVSSCHWGCGAGAARLSKGEEEKGEGVGWAQQDTLRGRRKLADRRELGSGAEAPGSGRAAMAEPGAAQTPETAEPCGGIPATELRPSHLTPLRLMYPSTERRGATGAGIRDAVRPRPRLSLRREGSEVGDAEGLLF